MHVNLDQETIGKLIGGSVLQSITQEQRDMLIATAVQNLITPEKNSYSGNSPIQRAFNYACENLARTLVEKQLAEDAGFTQTLNDIIAEGIAKVTVGEGRQKLVDKIAEAVKDSFGRY